MISGAQALAAIDHALQGQRDQIRELNERIQRTSAELMQLSQAESEQYKALAQIRVGQLATEKVIETLDQAERRIGEVLTARERALAELLHKIDEAQARQVALESERVAQLLRVEQAAKELDEVEATVQERLAADAAYQAQLERARQAERTAAHAEKKTALSEQDRIEKGKPYEEDPLFIYLWQRGYGTPDYTANPLIRYLDAKVARLCGYSEARANYALLREIPVRLREHTERLRKAADAEFASLWTLEQTAATAGGMPPLQEALAAEQKQLDAVDAEIERSEQYSQRLLQERAAFAAGKDDSFRQAIELMAAELRQDSIIALRREAQTTPLSDDDVRVERLAAIEQEKAQLQEALEQYQQVLRNHQQRLGELEAIRREFKRQRYDDVRSVFADGALLEVMLREFLGGLVSADTLWRTIQQQHRVQRIRSDPIFGSGGFGRPGGMWHGGWSGGGFGGGGFRTGGGFGSGGGFRTGGDF